jgi:hypothetical protein
MAQLELAKTIYKTLSYVKSPIQNGKWYRGPFVKSAMKQQHTTAIFWLQQGFITYYIIS